MVVNKFGTRSTAKNIPCLLRYPGGKYFSFHQGPLGAYIDPRLAEGGMLVEAFAGGASTTIRKAFEFPKAEFWLNDIHPAVFAVLYCVATGRITMISKALREIRVMTHDIYAWFWNWVPTDIEDIALRTIVLNRTNYGGMLLPASPQCSSSSIDRWNRDGYSQKVPQWIESISSVLCGRTRVTNLDWSEILSALPKNAVVMLDPPYLQAGRRIYEFSFNNEQHRELSNKLRACSNPWILTYDDNDFVKGMYDWAMVRRILTRSSNNRKQKEKWELMITAGGSL